MDAEKTKKDLNSEQQAAAYCQENAVVAAGAGSGKTMVLASRFAWLLTEKDYHVDEILTLTFTRKAAAQMYRRIYTVLSEIAAEDTGKKGQRARKALDDFVHARIQTLDSYSAALVKQAASRYGISPEFTVDNDRCWELANEEALPFFIAHRHHPAIERLYPQQSPEGIAGGIFASALSGYSFIDEVSNLTGGIKKQFDIICAEWKEQSGLMKDTLGELADLIAGNNALLPDLLPLIVPFNSGKIIFPGESAYTAREVDL
jgi:ATP-dependent helicase/nuclease subunit A